MSEQIHPMGTETFSLPWPLNEPPEDIFALSEHINLDPGIARDTFRAANIDDRNLEPWELAHISSLHEAAGGSSAQRLAAVVASWRDFTGVPVEEVEDPDDPTGELQIEEVCEKHGFDLDTFVRDISCYGFFHVACPDCGGVSLRQIQYDRIDETEIRHRIQYLYYLVSEQDILIEYIPDEVGSDDDPPEVGIECRKCGARHERGDLVIASQTYAWGYPDATYSTVEPEPPSTAVTVDRKGFVSRLRVLEKRAGELRDAMRDARRSAPPLAELFHPRDEEDEGTRRLLWTIEDQLDTAASEMARVLLLTEEEHPED